MNYNPETYWSTIYDNGVNAKSVCYPNWPLSYNQFLHQQQIEGLNKILAKFEISLQGKEVLEIGPGSGFWTAFFKSQKVGDYMGVELNRDSYLFLCQAFPNYKFINASASDSNLEASINQTFDLIFVAMVLLHITDNQEFEKTIALLKTKLKPNGVLIILDSVASKHVYGHQRLQTEGEQFDPEFHNKIRKEVTYRNVMKQYNLHLISILPAFNCSQMCFDFSNYISYLFFGKLFYALHRRILENCNENFGRFYANIIHKLDSFLTNVCGLRMSSKWMIIKKMES